MFLIRFVRAKKLNACQKLFQTILSKGMTVWYGNKVHKCWKLLSFPCGLIYAFIACQPPDRKIVLRPSRSRIRRCLADVAVRRHCRPTWKEYSDAAPDIAVTDARLLSKLHHAAVSKSAVLLRRRLRSPSPAPLRNVVVWLACFGRGREK